MCADQQRVLYSEDFASGPGAWSTGAPTKSGGCSGMTYDAVIVSARSDDDETIYQVDGIEVVTDAQSRPFLNGLQVDYSDDLISAGYRFNKNSNESSCGCGASFAVSGFPQLVKEGVGCGS